MPTFLEQLQAQRATLKTALAHIGDMRPGSLVGRFRSCGKPTCHCAKSGSPGHGPSYSLTREVAGKTITKIIPSGPAVEQTRQQIAEYQRFRELARELVAVSEEVCNAQLHALIPSSDPDVKKNGTGRSVARRRGRRDRNPSGSSRR